MSLTGTGLRAKMSSTESIEKTDEDLGLRFHMALDILWKLFHPADREAVCCHGITYTQWSLLRTLCEANSDALPMGFLASELGLTPSGVTRCADPLVERGLIERRTKPNDRRVCCLRPTSEGEGLWRKIRKELAQREGALIRQLVPDGAGDVVRVLENIAENAEMHFRTEKAT